MAAYAAAGPSNYAASAGNGYAGGSNFTQHRQQQQPQQERQEQLAEQERGRSSRNAAHHHHHQHHHQASSKESHYDRRENGSPPHQHQHQPQLQQPQPQLSHGNFYLNGADDDDISTPAVAPSVPPGNAVQPYQLGPAGHGNGTRQHPELDVEAFGEDADATLDDATAAEDDDDELSTTSGQRHGALLQAEEADMILFESPYMTQWTHKRHLTGGNPKPRDERDLPDWRMRERLRTVNAALVMCLNIGVDPPDVSKTNPCSKLLCWMDPSSIEVSKALPAIGKNLQAQFETLSMKTRYKQYLDPIVEETKRFCTNLRRSAKDERVLFYYNGFGVPKPTPGGEIWVFNKAYTQYIPVTLYDLQAWLGNPCIFVWDASSAGNIVVNFKRMAERRAEEEAKAAGGSAARAREMYNGAAGSSGDDQHFPLRESIHLAACGPEEVLPMNPNLPADLFTCCLTSPIEISLRWFVLQNPLPSQLNVDMVMNIPGRLQDRRTPLGELNWIFTAITDTIAWTVLPRAIFRRLFRDDLMVAALLRNFLLAERIMRFYHCTPVSHPKLPPTHNHPLWDSWDLAVDQCLSQLPTLLAKEAALKRAASPNGPPLEPHLAAFEYRHSTFFSEQLMAFEVWLSQGGVSRKGRRRRVDALKVDSFSAGEDVDDEDERSARDPPDQLPIVLQVLLSQVHRLRALILLSQFLDLGPWAVNMALSIGIFPYVLKLLQSPAADLKPVLIYIWARILAVDRSCQIDLLRDNGFAYFTILFSPFQQGHDGDAGGFGGANPNSYPIPNVSEHRAMCAFILSVFCQDFPAGQQACLQTDALDSCLEHLDDDDFLLRQWSALCIGQLWDDSSVGKARGIAKDVHGKFACMLSDISPEVRAAVLYALGVLLGASGSSLESAEIASQAGASSASKQGQPRPHCLGTGATLDLEESRHRSLEVGIATTMLATKGDSSPLVRKELVIALSPLVHEYQGFFVLAAYLYCQRDESKARGTATSNGGVSGQNEAAAKANEEALLTRIFSKLSLEEGVDDTDVANFPAFVTVFVSLLDLCADSHPEVASMASTVVDYITALMMTCLPMHSISSFDGQSVSRLLPTSTLEKADDYFMYIPRSKMSTANDGFHDQAALGLGLATAGSNGSSATRTPPHGTASPHSHTNTARRSTSLAQTVKSIATLGYSRPPSPAKASPGVDSIDGRQTAAPPKSVYLPPRVPAPRSNSARYVSPFAPTRAGMFAASSSSSPSTPAVPLEAESRIAAAHRSASAESLAQIARMQGRRANKAGGGSGPANTQPSTPSMTPTGSSKSPLVERLGSLSLTPTGRGSVNASPNIAGVDPTSPPSSSGNHDVNVDRAPDVGLADALAAVVAQDLQRFRDRAQLGNAEGRDAALNAGSTPMHSPTVTRFAGMTPYASGPNAIPATPDGRFLRETLPLKSKLFAWCSEYYREPQMKSAEADEPGSVQFNIQTWKRERNERILSEAQTDANSVQRMRWTETPMGNTAQSGSASQSTAVGVQVDAPAYLMRFHQYENHLVTASEQDSLSVWDWTTGKLLTRFNNGNPPRTNVTSLAFANEDAQTRLLVGSADGDVRIYADYDEPSWNVRKGPRLVSSMRALPHLVRSKRPSGLILDWQQISGSLLTGGDSRYIRIWDAHRELCLCDVPTRVSSCVTSISSEKNIGHIFVCGFGDGTIGTYDRRLPPELSLVRLWEEHSHWITSVHLQERGNRELVSASSDGTVKVWDVRVRKSLRSKDWSDELRGKLSSMEVHEGASIFALQSYPKPQRFGLSSQRTLLCDIESQDLLPTTRPIVRHFAQPNAGGPSSSATAAAAHAATAAGGMPSSGMGLANAAQQPAVTISGGHAHNHNFSQQSSIVTLSSALETPPSSFRPAMGSLKFHPHFPLLAFAGPDMLGYAGFTRAQASATGSALSTAAGGGHASVNAMSRSGSTADVGMLPPYSYVGTGSYGHYASGMLDGDDQRHIPTLDKGGRSSTDGSLAASGRHKSLFGFSTA